MTPVAPTLPRVRALVRALRQKTPREPVVGIHAVGRWEGPSSLPLGGEDVEVAQCDSVLEFRERLAEHSPSSPLVLVTPLTEKELGGDVLARLSRGRLFHFESWKVVLDLFQARHVDPRVAKEEWIADALVERAPEEGYPPVPSGMLDAETVWKILLGNGLGFSAARPDAIELLRWSMGAAQVEYYRTLPEGFRDGMRRWVVSTGGPVAEMILRCAHDGSDALSLGLACEVIFGTGAEKKPKLREAAVRLERFTGGLPIDRGLALAWARAAGAVLKGLLKPDDLSAALPWLHRADALLEEVRAKDYSYLSSLLLSGFEGRLARFGHELVSALQPPRPEVTQGVREAVEEVTRHELSRYHEDRVGRVRMALRLLGWLASESTVPGSFAEAARAYEREGAFVDWARTHLREGDGVRALSKACDQLLLRVTERREQENRRFGELLVDWHQAGAATGPLLPLEGVLGELVVPLARETPVLLVVVDGMSAAVFRELVGDVARFGWYELTAPAPIESRSVIAAVPTLTEACRASLLCGRLTTGASQDERQGFSQHPGLLSVSKTGFPPVLFHKGTLSGFGGGSLPTDVQTELSTLKRQVVGVVINAVDDYLLKADPVRLRWGLEAIALLRPLLAEARDAGRVVILASDHGHVLEAGSTLRKYDQGDRWRAATGDPAPGEVVVSGPRVLLGGRACPVPGACGTGPSVAGGEHKVLVPWSEGVRYGVKKNGYHGGVSPQEVVVPLAVLAAGGAVPAGWQEAVAEYPPWWEDPFGERPRPEAVKPAQPKKKPSRVSDAQQSLFALPTPPQTDGGDVRWTAVLLRSPVFESQRKLAGRTPLAEAQLEALLLALEERGGKLTRPALARQLGQPPIRLTGLLAAARRVLNVEGYQILSVDEASDTVEFNRELLKVQFGL